MKFIFFGREFYLFANEAQFNKFMGLLFQYVLTPAVITSALVVIFYCVLLEYYKKSKKPWRYRSFKRLEFTAALCVILAFTLLNRTENTREVIILLPDVTAGTKYYHESLMLFFALNVVLYTPYGYTLALFFGRGRGLKMRPVYLTVIPTSLAVEILQYIFAAGYSTAAEVIASFAGASIGILLYTFKYKILKPKTMRESMRIAREKLYD